MNQIEQETLKPLQLVEGIRDEESDFEQNQAFTHPLDQSA